ncbi:MAG: hypothetical protein RTU30_13785 [Candidatus Thorarchaeota archaeon]
MARRLLIVGMSSYDSGKTQFARQLVSNFATADVNVEYFKPISGHNNWFKNDHTQRCLQEKILHSHDAAVVRDAFSSKIPITIANPIHRLLAPVRLSTPSDLEYHSLVFGGWDSMLTIERLTQAVDGTPKSISLVAEKMVNAGRVYLTQDEMSILTSDTKIIPIDSTEELRSFEDKNFETYVQSCFEVVEGQSDVLIIESFNDAVWPWEGLEDVNSVIVVGPGHAFEYDPVRVKKAVSLLHKPSRPIRDLAFRWVGEYVKPLRRIELKPNIGLDNEELSRILRGT